MKKYIIILFIPLLFWTCDVDVTNPNTITTDTFWETESDAQSGVNAVYNMFYKPGTYSRWIWFRLDITSDEGYSRSPWAELKDWTQFGYGNYDFWEGNGWTYRDSYEAIYRANQVLYYVPSIPFAEEATKNQVLGQAHFLRGLYYYNLAILWGSSNKSLAINLELSTPAMRPEGRTVDEVFAQAIDDFTKAQGMLPNKWGDKNLGRATKGAALAYRAKCYMQQHQYALAKEDLKWMIEGEGSGIYDLSPKYADNFSKDTENNVESIFEIQYADVNKAPAGDGDFDPDPNLGQNRGQFFAPPGIGWTDGELRPWLVTEFRKEKDKDGKFDIRLRHTAFYSNMHNDFENNNKIYKYTSTDAHWADGNWAGRVFFRKYGSDNYRDFDDYHNPINIRLVRFADALLMYAECIVETGGSIGDAAKHVDRVRARVNMPNLSKNQAAALTSKEVFLKRLQMERVLELATEGHRWPDIKRWGLLDTQAGIDELKARDDDFAGFKIGRNSSLPIPSSEVRNNPNIEQNPNY